MRTAMEMVNELDGQVETIRHLGELAALIDGESSYFSHALTLLSLCAEHARDMEVSLRNLAAQLRCEAVDGGGV